MKYKCHILLLIICILQITIGIRFGMEKINYHVDEIYTFGLANNITGTTMSVPNGELINKDILLKYVTVDHNHVFDFANVWKNQAADVHPPFYYMLIHTICSFYPDKFIPMLGIGLNIMLSVIVTLLVYFIYKEITRNEMASVLASITWAFSLGNMTFIVFIRMYMLLSVLILAVTLLHLKYLHKKLSFKFYISVLLLSILGTLTQYYFLIYLFFLSLIFGLALLFQKKYKFAALYIFTYACAGIVSIGIFPSMVKHIFGGYRGEESFDNITNISDIWNRLWNYYHIIDNQLFDHFLLLFLIVILILGILIIIKNKKHINYYNIIFSPYSIICFPCICYFVIVSKISVYITDRYIMPIFPLILILVILAITNLTTSLFHRKYTLPLQISVFIFVSLIGLARNCNISYLYKETAPTIEFASKNKDSDVLVIYSGAWRLNSVYAELLQYDQLRFIPMKKLSEFTNTFNHYGNCIVYIIGDDTNNTLDHLIQINSNWNSYTLVNRSQYTNTYLLD